jgi:hypothetical protein
MKKCKTCNNTGKIIIGNMWTAGCPDCARASWFLKFIEFLGRFFILITLAFAFGTLLWILSGGAL